MNLEYPTRGYKTVEEFKSNEGWVDIKNFMETDDVVYADTSGSEVVEFFKGKSVLITGGTGFLGKLTVEKLLRSCKDIDKIYFLIRPRRGKDIANRTKEFFQNVVFSELKKVQPDFQDKIVPVYGDLSQPNLDMDDKDREMLKNNVHVIFHVAATVKLKERLKILATVNVAGTLDLLNLAKQCKNILSFVYVSTAYSNCIRKDIEEKLYEPPIEAENLLDLIKLRGDAFDLEEKSILGKWNSSYAFTKNIAEYAMKTHGNDLPVCIVRPAIVTTTFKEPLKRYIDNFYGSIGVIANNYAGVLRTINLDRDKRIETVPADFVVNACIVAAYRNYIKGRGNLRIYNYVSSVENPITISDLHNLTTFYGHQTPTNKCLWYPCNIINRNFYVNLFCTIFLHFVPATLVDLYLRLMGKKPWMLSVYKRIYQFSDSISWYGRNEWNFTGNNTKKLWEDLSEIDKKVFPFNMSKECFNWNEYLSQINLGVRLYLLNDKMDTMDEARRKHKKLYYLHVGTKCVLILIVFFLVSAFVKYL